MKLKSLISISTLVAFNACTVFENDPAEPQLDQAQREVGGLASVEISGKQSFSIQLKNLTQDQEALFFTGNSLFKKNWVIAPSSTTARDGLGPTFNAKSCSACHQDDGRATPPALGNGSEPLITPLLRLSIPGSDSHGGPLGDPNYGGQLNILANPNVQAEAHASLTWTEVSGQYPDGTSYSLRTPQYQISDWKYGAPAEDLMFSPRIGQQIPGLGLLEAIPESAILAQEDELDRDGDGISGKANRVWDVVNQKKSIGRFGWKANQPSIEQQVSGAFLGDIGITSKYNTQENCPQVQVDCQNSVHGNDSNEAYELDDQALAQVVFYVRTLAIPQARIQDEVLFEEGQELFTQIGCAKCHTPSFTTGVVSTLPQLSNQKIFPYTDLLLHDMGEALADNRPDYDANGQEWRTPPLWGIGLIQEVNGHMSLLHDGRARGIEEAILWHGGEAEDSREDFKSLKQSQRQAVIDFVTSI